MFEGTRIQIEKAENGYVVTGPIDGGSITRKTRVIDTFDEAMHLASGFFDEIIDRKDIAAEEISFCRRAEIERWQAVHGGKTIEQVEAETDMKVHQDADADRADEKRKRSERARNAAMARHHGRKKRK